MGCHASAGDLPDPGSEPASLHWQVGHLTTIATWEAPYFNHIAALSSSVCFSLLIFLHSHELVNYQRKNEYFLKSIQDIFCQNNLAEVIYICSKHILNIIFNWNIESVPLYYKNIYEFLLEFCRIYNQTNHLYNMSPCPHQCHSFALPINISCSNLKSHSVKVKGSQREDSKNRTSMVKWLLSRT